jgi:hypothetical protein
LFFLTTACAHRISITPPLHQLDATEISRIEKSVGYYISPDDLEKQVITPAGGGDKVKYLPYKESEPALKTILSILQTVIIRVFYNIVFCAKHLSFFFL